MINGKGEKIMEQRYGHLGGEKAPRFYRLNAPMNEWLEGRGPTYIDTTVLNPEDAKELRTDMLNERPSFVLFLASLGIDITKEPVEIYGSDPYIVGGHTGSGYWVEISRMTTVPGLFAAGESAGGSPNKFVGGCAAEGRLAARGASAYLKNVSLPPVDTAQIENEKERTFAPLLRGAEFDGVNPTEMEERLQRLMDEYAGGVHQFYRMNEERLLHALKNIRKLQEQSKFLHVGDLHGLMGAHEVIDRLNVAEVLIHHLLYRKETRWPGWQTRMDYPEIDPNMDCFVESVRDPKTGEIKLFTRPYEQLIPGDRTKP
jgi:adenylylsulfate reductase subunit A